MKFCIVTILFLLTIHPLFPQSFTTNIRVNDDAAGKAQLAPRIKVAPDRTLYVSWIDLRTNQNGDIYLCKSTDRGKSFSKNSIVYQGGKVNANYQRGANFVIDRMGNLHFVWGENKIDAQPDIFYSRSTDGGATFSPPISVSGDSSKYAQDFPSIAVDSTGNVYICFLDSRETQQGLSANVQLYFTKSTDGGNTFSQPIRATKMPTKIGGTCECCATNMAVTANGHVYIAFRTNINNRRDIFLTKSIDGGDTFLTAIPVASEQWIINACPVTGPSLALDREETAHVVWRDSRPSSNGKDYIYYATLRAGDSVCSKDMKISDTQRRSNYADISITSQGHLFVAYQDDRNDGADVFFTYSVDGGNTFSPGKKLSDEQSATRQEFVASATDSEGTRYAVWQDARRDNGDIVFARDTSSLSSALPGAVTLLTPANNAAISTFGNFVWSSPANLGSALHVRYDLMYQRDSDAGIYVRDITKTSHSTSLQPGRYRWTVKATSLIGSSDWVSYNTFTLAPQTSVEERSAPTSALALLQSLPNPLHHGERVTFRFILPASSDGVRTQGRVSLKMYDFLGREVRTVFDGTAQTGVHSISIEDVRYPSGVYYYRLVTNGQALTRKMTLLK